MLATKATKKAQRRQSIATTTLFLESVSCIHQKDKYGKDFIYVQIVGGKPGIALVGIMGMGETKLLSHSIQLPKGPCSLELWDKETISTNERIGQIDLQQCGHNEPQEFIVRNNEACYRLEFRLMTGR